MKMNNRVYGVVGIKSIMSNWNADFSGRPKSLSNGDIYGSDKAFKYPIKKMWEINGEKILYMKSLKINNDKKSKKFKKMQPRELKENYERIFNKELTDKTPSEEVLTNLFSALDVQNFGATFAEKEQNISITGAVQVGQGFNVYEDTSVEIQDILSPFLNSNKKEAKASTTGSKIMVDEAHYIYPFSINPDVYREYEKLLGKEGFKGYSQDAYNKFKKGCLVAATAFNTNSKTGCENEFALFIECKENSNLYLPNINEFVSFRKEGNFSIFNLSKLKQLLETKIDYINVIEVYYNKLFTKIETDGLLIKEFELY